MADVVVEACADALVAHFRIATEGLQRQLEHLQQVEHRDVVQAVGLAGNRQFDAADHRVVARVLQGDAAIHLRSDHAFVIEHLWNAGADADRLRRLQQERTAHAFMHAHAEIGLRQQDVLVGVEAHLRERRFGVVAERVLAAEQDGVAGRESGEELGTARRAQQHHVVHLHPQTFEQLAQHGRIFALLQRGLVVRPHVLVEAAQGQRAGVRFVLQDDVHVPEQLAGLAEVFRCFVGNLRREGRDAFQLGPAHRITAFRCHFNGQVAVAQNVFRRRFDEDGDGLVEDDVGLFGGVPRHLIAERT